MIVFLSQQMKQLRIGTGRLHTLFIFIPVRCIIESCGFPAPAAMPADTAVTSFRRPSVSAEKHIMQGMKNREGRDHAQDYYSRYFNLFHKDRLFS